MSDEETPTTEQQCPARYSQPDPAYPKRVYRYRCILPAGHDGKHQFREDRRIGVTK